jgi:hypothetical protein
MLHVAIIVHRLAPLRTGNYWLRAIAECWVKSGIRVSVVSDPRARIEADLAILHVDLTVTPKDYLACVQRCAATVNGAVSDISKRAISAHLLRREDRYEGPVIVKTDRNCAGFPEARVANTNWMSGKPGTVDETALHYYLDEMDLRTSRQRRYGSQRAFLDYRVFDSISEVPAAVWDDNELVVERFLPERIDGRYCIRTWLFFGDQDRHAIFYSHDPIIKSHNVVESERLSEVPDELRQMRRNLKFDFGKFDYTMVDGRPILFDANRTPTIGNFPKDRYLPLAQSLANGIGAFLPNAPMVKPQWPVSPEPAGDSGREEA